MSATGLWLWLAVSAEPACLGAVAALYERGEVVSAAQQAEACWRASKAPRALLLASESWWQARRFAAAWLAARRFFQVDRSRAGSFDRRKAELVQAEAEQGTGRVNMTLSPPPTPEEAIALTLQRDGEAADLALVTSWAEIRWEAAEGRLQLDPGDWQVKVERPGSLPKTVTVHAVARGETSLTVATRRRDARAPAAIELARVPVEVSFRPALAVGGGLSLEVLPVGASSATPLVLEVRGRRVLLSLTPGRWLLRARAGGRVGEQTITSGTARAAEVTLR